MNKESNLELFGDADRVVSVYPAFSDPTLTSRLGFFGESVNNDLGFSYSRDDNFWHSFYGVVYSPGESYGIDSDSNVVGSAGRF
jgi:hypothetical protein